MPYHSDPDYDKTNPPPALIHQQFDDEGEEQAHDYTLEDYELMDDDIVERADLGLYDPSLGLNVVDDSIEATRGGTWPHQNNRTNQDDTDKT